MTSGKSMAARIWSRSSWTAARSRTGRAPRRGHGRRASSSSPAWPTAPPPRTRPASSIVTSSPSEHPGCEKRLREARRFRAGQAVGRRRRADADPDARGRPDTDWHGRGNGCVHVAGAGRGTQGGRAQRHFLLRRRPAPEIVSGRASPAARPLWSECPRSFEISSRRR